jgi:hypothetical protein
MIGQGRRARGVEPGDPARALAPAAEPRVRRRVNVASEGEAGEGKAGELPAGERATRGGTTGRLGMNERRRAHRGASPESRVGVRPGSRGALRCPENYGTNIPNCLGAVGEGTGRNLSGRRACNGPNPRPARRSRCSGGAGVRSPTPVHPGRANRGCSARPVSASRLRRRMRSRNGREIPPSRSLDR